MKKGFSLIELMVESGLSKSKGEARRAVQGGGIYLNNRRVSDTEKKIGMHESVHGKFIVLRKGVKNYLLVRLV